MENEENWQREKHRNSWGSQSQRAGLITLCMTEGSWISIGVHLLMVISYVSKRGGSRLRAVSYFSLQSYCTRNPSTRAAKPQETRALAFIPYCNITSWFAIALIETRTKRILREKRNASILGGSEILHFGLKATGPPAPTPEPQVLDPYVLDTKFIS